MFVDSGGSVSILRKDIFDTIPPSSRPIIKPARMSLLTATGEASQFIGKVDLEIKLGVHVFKHEFLFAEIKDTAILGMDFFMKHKIDLLFSKGCIKVKEDFFPCFTNKGDPKCCIISVAETGEIPPESEEIIKGQIYVMVNYDSLDIIESNGNFVENTGLLIAKSVVQHNSNVIPLRVVNFSHQPVTVHKNTIATKFEPADVKVVVNKLIRRVQGVNVSPGLDLPEHLTELYNNSSKALSESDSRKLKEFLLKYQDVLSKSSSDIGYTELIQHGINTGNAPPIKLKPDIIPLTKREVAEKEIQDMANRGIIEPFTSAWCSPIVMVTKKSDNKIRFCCDFRRINDLSANDCLSTPRIDDILDSLSRNHWLVAVWAKGV